MKKQWDDIPLKGMLSQDLKLRMWKNIRKVTIAKTKNVYRWMAAASVILVMTAVGYQFFNKAVNTEHIVIMQTFDNDIRLVRLPDGSRVWLNEGTKIEYPENFDGSTRNIVLTGEAFFEVEKDSSKPFIISSGLIKTTVLGTSFNVKAYNGTVPLVEVRTGKVKVENKNGSIFLVRGDAAVYMPTSETLVRKKAEKLEPDYKKELLDVDGLALEDVVTLLQKDYDFSVEYSTEDLKKLKIKGTLGTKQGITEMLNTLAFALNLKVTETANHRYILSK
ncbi:FecR domain-containing protein [Flavobacterium rakeshii]|uniref:FecR family protein n=1 Tax=Flavobacterium rakeshii TaxID=1038845 RepID=UPI002E7B6194|nr:FecR domain-containing protein [Flavobacterium rakeshii]MEE1898628.1 FecR domain-containing protein [Flavobacterium rakeshii]